MRRRLLLFSRSVWAAYATTAVCLLQAGLYSNTTQGIDVEADAQSADTCLTRMAAPVLSRLGLTGVDVVVDPVIEGNHSTIGVVTSWQPNVIVLSADVAGWCNHDEKTNTSIEAAVAHEAAHIAQRRLIGAIDGPATGTVAGVPSLVRRAWLQHELGSSSSEVSGVERSADCTVIAFGYPSPADLGQGYGVECSTADLAASRAVMAGRWP